MIFTVDQVIQIVNIAALVIVGLLGRNKLQELHVLINSRLDQLLEARERAGRDKEIAAQAERVEQEKKG